MTNETKDKIIWYLGLIQKIGIIVIVWVSVLALVTAWNIEKSTPTQIGNFVSGVRSDIGSSTEKHLNSIETKVDNHLTTIENKADTQLTNLQTNTKGIVTDALNKADSKVDRTLNIVSDKTQNTLDLADKHLSNVENIASGVKSDADNITSSVTKDLPNYINNQYGYFIDCNVNDHCIPNLVQDTLTSSRESSKDISLTMKNLNDNFLPKAEKNFNDITVNVAGVTNNLEKLTHPRWYDRVLGYALNGIVIYRELNPAVNVPKVIVQTVSSQK